jgi:DNA helicase HerA-like ATPase
VVDHGGSFVIDMSMFESNAAQDRFAADFAERLYRAKASNRHPLHLMVDKADSFAPQKPQPGQQRMLGAFEAIVRRGRIRGLGATLISQRAAVINKNVLTQTECLIALQVTRRTAPRSMTG